MNNKPRDYSKESCDLLFNQLGGELRGTLKVLNQKYKGFYHFKLLTMVNLGDEKCQTCVDEHQTCLRAVIGFEEQGKGDVLDAKAEKLGGDE